MDAVCPDINKDGIYRESTMKIVNDRKYASGIDNTS